MTTFPWDSWIPGALSRRQVKELIKSGFITADGVNLESSVDNSSIDLSLADKGFEMIQGSVKPSRAQPYEWFIQENGLAKPLKKSPDDGTYKLDRRHTYVFKLQERLRKSLIQAPICGQATAKSSVGRVDVLARLIVDGMGTYECFDESCLEDNYGDMYLEITPTTFNVKVKPGISLSQLRLFYGQVENSVMTGRELFKTTLKDGPGAEDGSLSVDVTDTLIGGLPVGALCAKPPTDPNDAIPLWTEKEEAKKPDPCKYWQFVRADKKNRLVIKEEHFYLIRSKERIWVPPGIAIYCRASDETIGEMRIHYAGFVHPFFGGQRKDGSKGTPLMFEVRGHQVNVSLADQEKMATLTFYRMSEDCTLEDRPVDKPEESYQNQTLDLSKFFRKWPTKLKGKDNGDVEAT